MIKLSKNLKNYFSSSLFPYNPIGYKNITQYIQHHQKIKQKLPDFDVSMDKFIFAYNNFLDSILDDDFNIYVQQVCDKKLADQFIECLSRIQRDQIKIEKKVNNDVQEEIYFSDLNFFINVNRRISLYDNSQIKQRQTQYTKLTQFSGVNNEYLGCISIGAFIKSKFSIKISDRDYKPQNFHHVRFMVLMDEEELKGLFNMLKLLFLANTEKQMYVGKNPSWKLIDMDRNMQKKYPNFF